MIEFPYIDIPYNCKTMTIALSSIFLMFTLIIVSNENTNNSVSNYIDNLLSNVGYEGVC